MTMSATVFVPAYAKINLTLVVLGRRADGYHDLASIMQTISLHDTLRIGITVDASLTCATNRPELQTEDNLVLRAARLLRATVGDERLGAAIELLKETPIQGGLGGGSSDAAATLLALNRLWGAGLSTDRLETLAAQLGSDVPFFIHSGTARIGGRGEHVAPLPDARPTWLVVARPPVSVSTAAVFAQVSTSEYADAEDTERVAQAIARGEPLPKEHLVNSLEAPVMRAYPQVALTRDKLAASGAPFVRMSGSGPSLFAPFARLAEAEQTLQRARAEGVECWLCHTISHAQAQIASALTPSPSPAEEGS